MVKDESFSLSQKLVHAFVSTIYFIYINLLQCHFAGLCHKTVGKALAMLIKKTAAKVIAEMDSDLFQLIQNDAARPAFKSPFIQCLHLPLSSLCSTHWLPLPALHFKNTAEDLQGNQGHPNIHPLRPFPHTS